MMDTDDTRHMTDNGQRHIEFTLSTFNSLKEFVKSFTRNDTHKYCALLSDENTCL